MKFLNLGSFCFSTLVLLTTTFAWAAPAEQQDTDGWFCDQGEQNKEWVCVQNETIQPASNENPDNISSLSEPEKRDVRPIKELLETPKSVTRRIAPIENEEAETEEVESSFKSVSAPAPVSARPSEDEPAPATKSLLSDLPLYVQLSYKPGQPINISKLPPEFYVVQLMSLTEKANLEAYFAKHKLIGLSAARVESNGQILYVLLLGIYENYANAQQASENMPADLSDIKPWIRSLKSLQKAMLRADELSGSADF